MPLLLKRQNVIHAPRDFGKPLAVAPAYFGRPPAAIADFVECRQHGRPVAIPVSQLDIEAGARPLLIANPAAVLFDVDFENPLTEDADPLFGPAVVHDVADIEIGPHPRTLEFIDVAREFEGAEQKHVPDIFEGDLDPQLLRKRQRLADLGLSSLPGVGVRDFLVHDPDDEQHGRSTVGLGIAKRSLQDFESLSPNFRIGMR